MNREFSPYCFKKRRVDTVWNGLLFGVQHVFAADAIERTEAVECKFIKPERFFSSLRLWYECRISE